MTALLEQIESCVRTLNEQTREWNAPIHVFEALHPVLATSAAIRDTVVIVEDLWETRPVFPVMAWDFDEGTGTLTLVSAAYLGLGGETAVNSCIDLRKGSLAFFGAKSSEVKGSGVTRGITETLRTIEELAKIGRIRHVRHELLVDRLPPAVESESRASHLGVEHHFKYWSSEAVAELDDRESSWMDIHISFPVDVRPKALAISTSKESRKVLLTAINGRVLSDLYERYRGRILELNVRSFLQTKGKVNSGILRTIKESPDLFLALNNGISAVARRVTVLDGNIVDCKGFQIVNGGQTTAVIHAACYGSACDVSDVWVQTKITVLEGEEIEDLAQNIARCANTQNKISAADLSTNSQFLKEFECICNSLGTTDSPGWFFERSRGAWQTRLNAMRPQEAKLFKEAFPKNNMFDKTDLAKWLNAWTQRPHLASLGSQKNFTNFIHAVHDSQIIPDEEYVKSALAIGSIYRAALDEAKAAGIPAYRQNVGAYLVALLANRAIGLDLVQLWKSGGSSEGVSTFLKDYALDVSLALDQIADKRNKGEISKKPETWALIQERSEWKLNTALIREVTANSPVPDFGNVKVSSDGILVIRQMMAISKAEWISALEWAEGEPTASARDRSMLASCLAICVARQTPSERQAKYALSILERFRASMKSSAED